MERHRKDNRLPGALSLLMWPALARAPWLIGTMLDPGIGDSPEARRHGPDARRRR
jgi:hypothetical protein